MSLDIDEVMEMYIKAKRENTNDKLWQQWLVNYGRMDSEHFTSWEDYKKESMKPPLAKVDIEQVLKDAEEIKRLDQSTR